MWKREELEKELKHFFGFDAFYDDQWATLEKLLAGKRVLLIETF
jgi:superfamily II DNA helicase RecQ